MASETIRSTMLAWRLFGAGLEHFGEHDQPSVVPVPTYGPDELLMKVEAIGLCFSDVKLIQAGEQHPRVIVKDLKREPLIPGHEAVLKVVGVGANLRGQYEIGQRYIIQADIYYKGVNIAYGYAIQGGMAQYSVMNQMILNGDEGSYLLPISDKLSAAEAALIEPWTCVIAAYRIPIRTTLKDGGMLRVIGDGTPARQTLGALARGPARPGRVIVQNVAGPLRDELVQCAKAWGATLQETSSEELADDVIVVGTHQPEALAAYARQLARNGVFCLVGAYQSLPLSVDIGRIHYHYWRYVGTRDNDVSTAYVRNARTTLKPGGVTWFAGGAGAMGQMHVQRAVEDAQGPRTIVVSDLDDTRLSKLAARLQHKAAARGVKLAMLNPKTFADTAAFHAALRAEAPRGFDDIVMLVPVPAVVSEADAMLAEDGVMNVFAGIPAGNEAVLDMGAIVSGGHRYIASSGSRMDDIRHTLAMTEARQLEPVYALGAIGGMRALKEGIIGVMQARFPGKTVIYPHAVDLPLTGVGQVERICPGAGALLEHGEVYTRAAEDAVRTRWE